MVLVETNLTISFELLWLHLLAQERMTCLGCKCLVLEQGIPTCGAH